MSVKLLTEYSLKFLNFTGGCTGSSESTLVKLPHCWKSHVMAQMFVVHKLVIIVPQRMLFSLQASLYQLRTIFYSSIAGPEVIKLISCSILTGACSTVDNVSDCRSRGRELNPGPVPYFCED